MAEPAGRTILVINGRVLVIGPSHATRVGGRAAGWGCLALFGATLLALGIPIVAGVGSFAAIGGVVFFVAAGVVAGSERYSLATALGSAGVVWSCAGIAVYLGTDPSLTLSALVFAVVGTLLLFAGGWSALQHRRHVLRPSANA